MDRPLPLPLPEKSALRHLQVFYEKLALVTERACEASGRSAATVTKTWMAFDLRFH